MGSDAEIVPRRGQRLVSRSAYQARAFVLSAGLELPEDPKAIDRGKLQPRLVPIARGEAFQAITGQRDGEVYVRVERDGTALACLLLAGSFDVA
jgi:hypothetical protein